MNTTCIFLFPTVTNADSRVSLSRLKSSLGHLLPVPSGTTYSNFLSFSFLLCKMETVWTKTLWNVDSYYKFISTAKVVTEGKESQRVECPVVLGPKLLTPSLLISQMLPAEVGIQGFLPLAPIPRWLEDNRVLLEALLQAHSIFSTLGREIILTLQ